MDWRGLVAFLDPLTQSHVPTRNGKQDTDVRWNTIAGAVDDRTPAERGEVASEDARQVVGGIAPIMLLELVGAGTRMHAHDA